MNIQSILEQSRQDYAERNPLSLEHYQQACETLPGGNTRTVLFYKPFPLTICRGQRCNLWDADDHEYVDFLGEYTAGLFGHSNPIIRTAIDNALDGGISFAGNGQLEAKFAKALCDRFPSIDLVRFTNSGTEANLMALATARVVTGRKKILVFERAYHGGILSFHTQNQPTNVPHEWIYSRFNDMAGTKKLLDKHSSDLAAILVEPMIGSGGCIPGEPAFLRLLRDEATRHDSLLIFDEVMTSRLSSGGIQKQLGILPDMTTLGKYIGGGMPIGAFGGKREIMELYDPRRSDALTHSGTFNNNVLTMAAGHTAMTQVFTAEVADELSNRGNTMRERLNTLAQKHDAAMQVTGYGSLMNIHFTNAPIRTPADLKSDNAELKELFFFDMLERGFYIAPRGLISLNLEISDMDIDNFVKAVDDFAEERKSFLRNEYAIAN